MKSVDTTVLFQECGIRYKQRSFHNKGLKITEKGDEKTSAPMRFSHESVSKETAVMIVTVRQSLCRMVRKTVSYWRAAGAEQCAKHRPIAMCTHTNSSCGVQTAVYITRA